MMQRLAAQLRARDEQEGLARIAHAVPPTEELIMSGPVPLEFTPRPSLGPVPPGGIGPRQNLDPRFGDYPATGSSQELMMTLPMSPKGLSGRAEQVRLGYGTPASLESFYPAVEEARRRGVGSGADSAPFRDYLDAKRQAFEYANPRVEAYRERRRLLEESRAREAARQRRLQDVFGTPEERAQQIMELEASLFRDKTNRR
tara:strand:- start:781 stop:1383 length:603 start_codon:yes stop_codon:yes gene_type:complete